MAAAARVMLKNRSHYCLSNGKNVTKAGANLERNSVSSSANNDPTRPVTSLYRILDYALVIEKATAMASFIKVCKLLVSMCPQQQLFLTCKGRPGDPWFLSRFCPLLLVRLVHAC